VIIFADCGTFFHFFGAFGSLFSGVQIAFFVRFSAVFDFSNDLIKQRSKPFNMRVRWHFCKDNLGRLLSYVQIAPASCKLMGQYIGRFK
jgi:hypothetical protein